MKTDIETIASASCGVVLGILGLVATVVAFLSISKDIRPFLHVSDFRIDYMIIGPMVMFLSKVLLTDLFKRDGMKGKKGIR